MEHDQRVCPRCGKPAGEYRFCASCRSQLDLLAGVPTRAAAQADPISSAVQTTQEVGRREEGLAAASNADNGPIISDAPPASVQVHPDPRPAAGPIPDTKAAEVARVSDRAQAPREVARLEEVLTVKPSLDIGRVAAEPAAIRARTDIEDTAPGQDLEVAPNGDAAESDWDRLRREVARLEHVLSEAAADPNHEIAAKTAAGAKPQKTPASDPRPVASHALRAAFWFEQASAFKANDDDEETTSQAPPQETTSQAPPPPAPVAETPVSATTNVEAAAFEADDAQGPGRNWLAGLCILALIGLVAVLVGRDLRRCRCNCGHAG